ncbi:glycosyl transferase [Patiriisocius marinistellae]|uniref:Glycosyl transferase n=1 Tax=Patiriisocius marinistellae TaxID=2494560 RepID=A0A5J4G332_9FLAO|nr:glycosyltransferase family 2 protein [Patiriisocius marinistellae]GEQ87319.1 glycosyl transferase [Patiriisocius marinistellae]
MISVLIPTYNYDVRELVNNVHKQCVDTGIDFEISIVDDYSTNSLSCENNEKLSILSHVNYTKNKENLGRTATRNKLAVEATFEWLLFLDADVLPKDTMFISSYVSAINKEHECIYGGISYTDRKPNKELILRWTYGKQREVKTVSQRKKFPFDVISQNLCIRKSTFLKCNPEKYNAYGMDILFSYNLKMENIKMLHIDNPIVHHGLEDAVTFLKKSLNAVESTYNMEKEGLISNDARPLQRVYLKLQKGHGLLTFQKSFALVKKQTFKNLHSAKPSMRLLDAFKLSHFIKLKRNG